LKKQSKYLNTGFLFAGGVLILYVLSRFIKMKKPAVPKPTTGYRPTPLSPNKNVLSFDEIFQWIKKEESGSRGPLLKAVPDGKDKKGNQLFSIGYGHQIQPNEIELMTETITPEKALELFAKDVEAIRKQMNSLIKVPINKNQQLALLSLRYNIGGEAFKDSTLLKLLNQGNYTGAALRFAEWRLSEGKISNGLVARRERERQLFSKPV
jgi:GH24 family phage-related lysozyme (muramidase)